MTIFDFSNAYLKSQTAQFLPELPLDQLDCYRTPHIYSWSPYFCCEVGNVSKYDVMKLFAFILQNRFNLPNVINFEGNFAALCTATENFDLYTLARLTPEALTARLAEAVGCSLPSHSWEAYAEGLIDAARYLIDLDLSYNDYITQTNENSDAVLRDICRIRGIGPALARNFLKELGVMEFGKPDVHLLEVFRAFDPTVINEESFDRSLEVQAARAGVSPYEFDRVIWLICTGDYFKHHLKIKCSHKTLRENFIAALNAAIASGSVTV